MLTEKRQHPALEPEGHASAVCSSPVGQTDAEPPAEEIRVMVEGRDRAAPAALVEGESKLELERQHALHELPPRFLEEERVARLLDPALEAQGRDEVPDRFDHVAPESLYVGPASESDDLAHVEHAESAAGRVEVRLVPEAPSSGGQERGGAPEP